jgi:hypothetical protein
MACNGYNHSKSCKCNFRGGHLGTRPPTWRGWSVRSARWYFSGPNAKCPECRAPVFYVPGPRGGGTYFDRFGPPWPKHACTNKPKLYSPYGSSDKPKLRNRRSEFERDRWLPFFIRNIERLAAGTIIHGVALDDPTVLHFGSLNPDIAPDQERPIYFRAMEDQIGLVELNFFPLGLNESVSASLFNDCRSDIELHLQRTSINTPPHDSANG